MKYYLGNEKFLIPYSNQKNFMKSISANGKKGCLLRAFVPNDSVQYYIRFYEVDGSFKDYEIAHTDLFFTIDDIDAYLYETEDGSLYIDHSPKTLGKE